MPTPNNALTTRNPPCGGVALPAGRVAGGLFLQQVSESAKGDGVDVFKHSAILVFLPKKGIANACEKRFLFRRTSERSQQWNR